MKTYLHYLWHLLKETWKEEPLEIIFPMVIGSGLVTAAVGMVLMGIGFLDAGLVASLVGLFLFTSPLWVVGILHLSDWIEEKYENYKRWKFSVSTKRKEEEKP